MVGQTAQFENPAVITDEIARSLKSGTLDADFMERTGATVGAFDEENACYPITFPHNVIIVCEHSPPVVVANGDKGTVQFGIMAE